MLEINNFALVIGLIGVIAFVLNIIVELTKDLPFLKDIPTVAYVLVLSPVLCLLAYFGYISYVGATVLWYMVVAVIVGSFVVAYVAMYGWEKFYELWERFSKEV